MVLPADLHYLALALHMERFQPPGALRQQRVYGPPWLLVNGRYPYSIFSIQKVLGLSYT